MPFAVEHLPELDYIEVTFSGVLTAVDLNQATTAGISLAKLNGLTKVLINVNVGEVSASLMDLYDLPEQYAKEGWLEGSPIAVILPITMVARQAASDYEIFCQNRGWNVRVCPDRQAAVAWLTGTKSR
jgi:hypothetical protein